MNSIVRRLLLCIPMTVVVAGPSYAQQVEGKDLKIGAVLKTLANPYWLTTQQGIEAKAKELGAKVTVQAGTDESSIDEQTNILQSDSAHGHGGRQEHSVRSWRRIR